jgi:alpha-glucoside transport system substrate-binding protein
MKGVIMRIKNHHWHLIGSITTGLLFSFLILAMGAIIPASQALASTSIDPSMKSTSNSNEIFLPAVLYNSRNMTVYALVGGGEDGAQEYDAAMLAFEQQSGIQVVFEGSDDFENDIVQRAISGTLPDVAFIPQPGLLYKLMTDTIDLNEWFSSTYLQQQYAPDWLSMVTKGGELLGVWHRATIKSLVWYAKDDFDAAGYEVPTDWDEMVALSDQIVADGGTPWCVGIASGVASGWVGTDWVEDIMLRTNTPEDFDRWVAGDLKFSSPQVKNAWETMGEIWFTEDYVLGGRSEIPDIFFYEAFQPLFDDPAGCYMHRQAMFIRGFIPESAQIGVEVDYFLLPPIDPQYGEAVLTAGDLLSAFEDRDEVREFVEYITTKESTEYYMEQGTYLSPHKDATVEWYPDELEGFARILINADTVRFDASDQMPEEVGTTSFWQGIVDYVNGTDLDTILADIDTSWP